MGSVITKLFYIVAQLYIYPGKEAEFHEYETQALHIARKHGGELICAFTPVYADAGVETPTEIHVLRFFDREAFDTFKSDPEHVTIADLRSKVISKTVIVTSNEIVDYCKIPGD